MAAQHDIGGQRQGLGGRWQERWWGTLQEREAEVRDARLSVVARTPVMGRRRSLIIRDSGVLGVIQGRRVIVVVAVVVLLEVVAAIVVWIRLIALGRGELGAVRVVVTMSRQVNDWHEQGGQHEHADQQRRGHGPYSSACRLAAFHACRRDCRIAPLRGLDRTTGRPALGVCHSPVLRDSSAVGLRRPATLASSLFATTRAGAIPVRCNGLGRTHPAEVLGHD